MQTRTDQNQLTVTAVIPVYNGEKVIARAINSVLKQTLPADEIIIVDDGSADNTVDVVRSFGDSVILIQQPNSGASAARNAGINAAKGNWIAFLDGDDEWLPFHLQKITHLLGLNPDLAWAGANYITCSCTEQRQSPYVAKKDAEKYLQGREVIENYFEASIHDMAFHTDTMVIRRAVLFEAGLFRVDQKKANDLDMWWRIAFRHPQIGYISSPTAIYHLTIPESISTKTVSWRFYADLIERHREHALQFGQSKVFGLLAAKMLRVWIRSMLFDAQKQNIRSLLRRFSDLLPAWYCVWMWLLTVSPKLTQSGCLLLSSVIRTLKLRRRVVSPPANASRSKAESSCS